MKRRYPVIVLLTACLGGTCAPAWAAQTAPTRAADASSEVARKNRTRGVFPVVLAISGAAVVALAVAGRRLRKQAELDAADALLKSEIDDL